MSKTWAIVLSIIGGLFLLSIIAVGGIVYWVYQNKDKWTQSFEQVEKESKDFGAKTDNEGCLKEALSRHKNDKSITGQISTTIFLGTCLQKSAPSPGFCDGIPAKGEIIKSNNWKLKKCSDAGLQNDQGCQQILDAVQEYCRRGNQRPEN
jgi:hypothetical protein